MNADNQNTAAGLGGYNAAFPAPISKRIWDEKYRLTSADGTTEAGPDDTFARVARVAAANELAFDRGAWEARFKQALSGYRFLPAGRILAGAGSGRDVTLFNCFVMGEVPDSLDGIFDTLKQSALTLQTGGGIGVDFSTVRPRGALVASIGSDASGPISFMDVWDAMCQTIMSAGARRGAMMATLRADHPDIEDFIDAKCEPGRLTNFNLSVLVPDALMQAVAEDAPWALTFGGHVYKTLPARQIWQRIMRATYETSEPGVIFIDRINAENNLAYCEKIRTTNPCGEQPLPPFGACLLGSFNLARYVAASFTADAKLDLAALKNDVHTAVRLLDNLIDISHYPLEAQRAEAIAKRRMGLGVTGLANALIFCGLHYDSEAARTTARGWMSFIQTEAYAASAAVAAEKGPFPLCDRDAILNAPNVQRLPKRVRDAIARDGLRNGCLTSIAPTGTISLLAGNVSSGIEPVFDLTYQRQLLRPDGSLETTQVEDFAFATYESMKAGLPNQWATELPQAFVTAEVLSPQAHLAMQNALQPYVDSSISKTINCPADLSFEDFETIYSDAYRLGLKGCTTYRPSALRGSVLATTETDPSHAGAARTSPAPEQAAPMEPASLTAERAPSPARDWQIATGAEHGQIAPDPGELVYIADPLERDRALAGVTYKLKWPESDHAIYVTLNDIEHNGRRRPFEIFINTRNLEHYAWTVALTRMISAVFRRGGDVAFVAEELKAVFDPQGGRWMGGRYVPSLLAAIGDIIEEHLRAIGFQSGPGGIGTSDGPSGTARVRASSREDGSDSVLMDGGGGVADSQSRTRWSARSCPKCGLFGLERREGCWVCPTCGYSKCG